MFKKFVTTALVFVVLAVSCMIPASAAGLDAELVYDFRFEEVITDAQDMAESIEARSGEVPTFYDDTLGMYVAEFAPESQLVIKGADTQSFTNMTYEMYVKITSDMAKPVTLLNITNSGVSVMAKRKSAVIGMGKGGELKIDPLPKDEWFHLVCSIGSDVQVVYVNGVEVGRKEGSTSFVGSTSSVYLGQYETDTGMELAAFRLYSAAATPEDVTAMYEAVSNGSSNATEAPTEEPEATPTAEPAEDSETTPPSPTAKATASVKPTLNPSSEPAAEGGLSGAAIAGIIVAAVLVVAAIVVVIIVVVKKKKK